MSDTTSTRFQHYSKPILCGCHHWNWCFLQYYDVCSELGKPQM